MANMIDTDADKLGDGATGLAQSKIGLLSSINLTPELIKAFEDGAGDIPKKLARGYRATDLQNAMKELTDPPNNCQMIATVGGSIVDEALTKYAGEFVSLLGTFPPKSPKCVGGIVLESIKSNKDRIEYLVSKLGREPTAIGLYRNPGSAMQATEASDWRTLKAGPIVSFSGWDPAGKTNDAATFGADFQNIPKAVSTLIISADPFFQENKQALISAANSWVRQGDRYVCYPLQDYRNVGGASPEAGKTLLYGPRLRDAYRVLGFVAKLASTGTEVGFYTPLNSVAEI